MSVPVSLPNETQAVNQYKAYLAEHNGKLCRAVVSPKGSVAWPGGGLTLYQISLPEERILSSDSPPTEQEILGLAVFDGTATPEQLGEYNAWQEQETARIRALPPPPPPSPRERLDRTWNECLLAAQGAAWVMRDLQAGKHVRADQLLYTFDDLLNRLEEMGQLAGAQLDTLEELQASTVTQEQAVNVLRAVEGTMQHYGPPRPRTGNGRRSIGKVTR